MFIERVIFEMENLEINVLVIHLNSCNRKTSSENWHSKTLYSNIALFMSKVAYIQKYHLKIDIQKHYTEN